MLEDRHARDPRNEPRNHCEGTPEASQKVTTMPTRCLQRYEMRWSLMIISKNRFGGPASAARPGTPDEECHVDSYRHAEQPRGNAMFLGPRATDRPFVARSCLCRLVIDDDDRPKGQIPTEAAKPLLERTSCVLRPTHIWGKPGGRILARRKIPKAGFGPEMSFRHGKPRDGGVWAIVPLDAAGSLRPNCGPACSAWVAVRPNARLMLNRGCPYDGADGGSCQGPPKKGSGKQVQFGRHGVAKTVWFDDQSAEKGSAVLVPDPAGWSSTTVRRQTESQLSDSLVKGRMAVSAPLTDGSLRAETRCRGRGGVSCDGRPAKKYLSELGLEPGFASWAYIRPTSHKFHTYLAMRLWVIKEA